MTHPLLQISINSLELDTFHVLKNFKAFLMKFVLNTGMCVVFSINVSFSNRTFGCLILLSHRLTVLAGFFTKQNPSLANPVPLFVVTKITRSNTACAPPFKRICNIHCQNQQPICRSSFLRRWITEVRVG